MTTTEDRFANTFDKHAIRSRVEAPGFGSWLLMRRYEDGDGWSYSFWCRVTAADGMLRVSGDFDPIIFRGGCTDPLPQVAWMGGHDKPDGYVREKASIGSSRDACVQWSTDDAIGDLREMIREREAELEDEARAEHGDDRAEWPDDDLCCSTVQAMQAGIDAFVDYDGREGVHQMLEAIRDCDHEIEMECVYEIGERPSNALVLAHLAVRHLHKLLTAEVLAAEEAKWIAIDSEEAAASVAGKLVLVDAPAIDGRDAHELHGCTTRAQNYIGYLRSQDSVQGLSWSHRGNVRVKLVEDQT